MADVIITGIGQTPVGELWERSLRSLAVEAMGLAIRDSGGIRPQALFAANIHSANISHQAHLGTFLADMGGLVIGGQRKSAGIEATTVEAGGASGGMALRQAYQAISSGLVESAMVIGVEKTTDMIGPERDQHLSTTEDADYESMLGLTPTTLAALLMQRYMFEFKVKHDFFTGFPVTAHGNARNNPFSMYKNVISEKDYQEAGSSCEPLNMYDVAPDGDGAAAVILINSTLLTGDSKKPSIRIMGSSAASDKIALHDRSNLLAFSAAKVTVEDVLTKSKFTRQQIDLFEYHDSSSIHAALSLEAAGFAEYGKGWQLAEKGDISLTGQIPCATMGGLKARGNPGGATGVYQAVEAALQLRGEAGSNQIPNARIAMLQSLNGAAATAVTHILERMD